MGSWADLEGLDERRVAVSPVEPGPGQETDLARLDAGMHAVAVPLKLAPSFGAFWSRVGQRAQLGRYEVRP